MEKPNKLFTFGCSHTWGSALPDVWDPKDKHLNRVQDGERIPSKLVWGEVVANLWKCKHINCGHPGASNRLILLNILKRKYTPGDCVIILWSHTHRHTHFPDDKTLERWGPWNTNTSRPARYWMKFCYSSYNSIIDSAQHLHHAKLYLDSLDIPNYHVIQTRSGLDSFNQVKIKNIPWMKSFAVQDVYFDEWRKIPPLAMDNGHAGENAHREFGKAVWMSIISNKQKHLGKLCAR